MESKSTVFVVDDDPEIRRSLTRLLEEVDLAVQTYSSAREFLEAYDPGCQGCLVLDVRMPGTDGIALQKTLKEKGISLPVIIITGHGDVPMAVEAMQRGALDFIEKPFRAQPLLERINQALTQGAENHRRQAEKDAVAARVALLTARQRQVMALMAAGETTKTIAASLELSVKTVDYHRAKVMETMQARSMVDLARMLQVVENDGQPLQNCHAGTASS
jgi:FixJ family two-component response regulator